MVSTKAVVANKQPPQAKVIYTVFDQCSSFAKELTKTASEPTIRKVIMSVFRVLDII
jgi:hypothetical protein